MEQSRSTFRPARVGDYVDWLRGYLADGGEITHAYDYPIARMGFLVARSDFTTGGECGVDAAQIIVHVTEISRTTPSAFALFSCMFGHTYRVVLENGQPIALECVHCATTWKTERVEQERP